MKPFWESTTAQFGIAILTIAALAVGFADLTWEQWLEAAKWILALYAGKEGIRYSASAYEKKGG